MARLDADERLNYALWRMYVDLWHWHTSIVRTFDVDLRIPMGGFGVGNATQTPLVFFLCVGGSYGVEQKCGAGVEQGRGDFGV